MSAAPPTFRLKPASHPADALRGYRQATTRLSSGSPPELPASEPEDRERPSTHRCTVITAVGVRPNTSGSYISSARAGAVRNVPAVVARTT